jgi:hypothetical protein
MSTYTYPDGTVIFRNTDADRFEIRRIMHTLAAAGHVIAGDWHKDMPVEHARAVYIAYMPLLALPSDVK